MGLVAGKDGARYVIIGAGVHGLSTGWHLAKELKARGRGTGDDVLILDKTGIGAGPSGLACGVVRNNYFQPAMRQLMAHNVSVWESDPEAFHYHPVGFMQISPEVMHADIVQIYGEQQAIGYESVLIEGEDKCCDYMRDMFPDWQAKGITSVLHEKKGGYAENMHSMRALAGKAQAEGVELRAGVRVTGVRLEGGCVVGVETDHGYVACEHLIVGAGPWVRDIWRMLGLPATVTVLGRDGKKYERPMWTYWCLQEGTLGVDPNYLMDSQGKMPPVIHVDTDAPLVDDEDGSVITDKLWGIYYKPDFNFGGVQGGSTPWKVEQPADKVAVDPYGPKSKEFVVGPEFERMWTSGLAHCHKRFEGKRGLYHKAPTGGIGAFTPDNFPVFDAFQENAYVVADSNHGYKMIGVGALVAKELMGEKQGLLEPFRFSRYEQGKLHPVSHSPFPWS
ncbi:MAG TPA: FAD-binding oxidoreductase [Candidatus Dormibacteraeota bacterium]|nr:FAD-binding oxidoreductase [Candidatus Dormibacteraeota bacterium]